MASHGSAVQSPTTQHASAPRNDRNDRNDQIGLTDVGRSEFDDIECIFDSNMDGIRLQHDISFGMCIVSFSFFFFLCCLFFFFFFFFCCLGANEWSCFLFCFFVFILTQKENVFPKWR